MTTRKILINKMQWNSMEENITYQYITFSNYFSVAKVRMHI